jgi:uncharacterized membrane protein YkoI
MAQINKTTAGIMLAAVIGGGAIGAAAIPAMADDGTGTSSSSTTAPDGNSAGYGSGYGTPGGQGGPHQANGKTEEVLTGDTATKVEAAVKAAQPDATIERMETDADGATYEAHITKADGTRATVLLDANFTVTETQDQGQGGPGGGHGGPNDGDADDAATDGSTSNG